MSVIPSYFLPLRFLSTCYMTIFLDLSTLSNIQWTAAEVTKLFIMHLWTANPRSMFSTNLSFSSSASWGILCNLWNPKIYWCVHNSPPCVAILSHMHPVHILHLYFIKICCNVTLHLLPRHSKQPLSFTFSHQNSAPGRP